MFKKAAVLKLRFSSTKGLLTVEDLFDLPLNSTRAGVVSLNSVAMTVYNALKETEEINFVDEAGTNDTTMQLRMDIVKEVISIKKAANAAKLEAKARAEKKKRLTELIGQKQDAALADKPLAELLAMVDEL